MSRGGSRRGGDRGDGQVGPDGWAVAGGAASRPAPKAGDLSQFGDTGALSNWAQEGVSWAVGAGLISGKGDGVLDPQGATTRAEAAVILQRFLEK